MISCSTFVSAIFIRDLYFLWSVGLPPPLFLPPSHTQLLAFSVFLLSGAPFLFLSSPSLFLQLLSLPPSLPILFCLSSLSLFFCPSYLPLPPSSHLNLMLHSLSLIANYEHFKADTSNFFSGPSIWPATLSVATEESHMSCTYVHTTILSL